MTSRDTRIFKDSGGTRLSTASFSWWGGRNVSRKLEFLEWQGLIMVAGRREGQPLWDLTERVLPKWAPRERLSEGDFSRRVVEGMLQAAGVARVAAPNRWVTADRRLPSRVGGGPGGP